MLRVVTLAEADKTIGGLRDAALIRLMSDCLLRISEAVAVDMDYALEYALRKEFGIGAGSAKDIIVAIWRSDQWVDVCVEYAKANRCVEYHEILGI